MPRDAIAITDLAANGGIAEPAGTTINVTNGGVINAAGDTSRLVIRVANTFAGAKIVTVKAGANPPALRKGVGDLAVSVPASTGVRLLVVESARFVQADGTIQLDYESGMTGTVGSTRVPKAV